MNLRDALAWATAAELARIDAEVLLAHAIGGTRATAYTRPERELSESEHSRYVELVARRKAGWPIAYLTGHREFRSLSLIVTPDVLIPRHDTEVLVESALVEVDALFERDPEARPRVLDLGTGSGAIAIAIAHARPDAHVVATDASDAALTVARMNAHALGLSNLAFAQGDWYAAIGDARFDVIVSNPPYLAAGDPHLGLGDLRYEPAVALVSGHEGLDAIEAIAKGARAHLVDGSVLLVEHGMTQGEAVRGIFERHGLRDVDTRRDLEDRDRVTLGRG